MEAARIDEKIKKDKVIKFVQENDHLKLSEAAKASLDLSKLQQEANEKIFRAKEEEKKRRVEQSKRMDYLTRALREAERAKLDAALAGVSAEASSVVAAHNAVVAATNAKRLRDATELGAKLHIIGPCVAEFLTDLAQRRKAEYEATRVSLVCGGGMGLRAAVTTLSVVCCALVNSASLLINQTCRPKRAERD